MVGNGRIPEGHPRSLIIPGQNLLHRHGLSGLEPPKIAAHGHMQRLGESLGQPVGEQLRQDGPVFVAALAQSGHQFVQSETRTGSKRQT